MPGGEAEPCAHTMMEESVREQICLQNRAQPSLSLRATAGSVQQNKHTHTDKSMGIAPFLTKVQRFVIITGQKLKCKNVAQS